MYRVKIERHIL